MRELREKRYNLVVEFFLPSHLMLIEMDRRQMLVAEVESIALGTKYYVRMRSLAQPNLDYLDFNYDRWNEIEIRDFRQKNSLLLLTIITKKLSNLSMEHSGFEPLTSCMPCKHSTN